VREYLSCRSLHRLFNLLGKAYNIYNISSYFSLSNGKFRGVAMNKDTKSFILLIVVSLIIAAVLNFLLGALLELSSNKTDTR